MSSAIKSGISDRDVEILASAFQCQKSAPEIDYDKLAILASFKNASSARVSFNVLKRKLAFLEGGVGSSSITTVAPKTAKKPAQKKSKKRNASSDDEDDAPRKVSKTKATVTKDTDEHTHIMPYKGKGKAKVVKKEEPEESEGDVEVGAEDDEEEEITAEELLEREVGLE